MLKMLFLPGAGGWAAPVGASPYTHSNYICYLGGNGLLPDALHGGELVDGDAAGGYFLLDGHGLFQCLYEDVVGPVGAGLALLLEMHEPCPSQGGKVLRADALLHLLAVFVGQAGVAVDVADVHGAVVLQQLEDLPPFGVVVGPDHELGLPAGAQAFF